MKQKRHRKTKIIRRGLSWNRSRLWGEGNQEGLSLLFFLSILISKCFIFFERKKSLCIKSFTPNTSCFMWSTTNIFGLNKFFSHAKNLKIPYIFYTKKEKEKSFIKANLFRTYIRPTSLLHSLLLTLPLYL